MRRSSSPLAEQSRLARSLVFTVLIGNADAHAKNLALLHPSGEVIELAPLYDTVPTVLWPALKDRAAMLVAGQDRLSAVSLDDVRREVRGWRVPRAVVDALPDVVEEIVEVAPTCGHDRLASEVVRRGRRLLDG